MTSKAITSLWKKEVRMCPNKKKKCEGRIRLGLRRRWFSDDVEKGIYEVERG